MRKRLLQLAVLALVLYAAVYLGYQWMQAKVDSVLGPGETAGRTAQDGQGENGALFTHEAAIQQILAHNIFKAALDKQPGKPVEDFRLSELAASSGPLELLGTVTGSDRDARAIIRSGADQREQIYRLGDQIQGAEIVRIERGRVALATSAGPELLLLKERENSPAPSSSLSSDAAAPLEEMPLLVPPQNQSEAAGGRIVPQSLPGRRINTTGSSAPPSQAEAAGGVPVRTGAAALQPLEVPWQDPAAPANAEQGGQ